MLRRDDVAELTVEDPAEAFEDLRDRNDLRWLVAEGIMDDPEFLRGIGTGIRGDRGVWENEKRRKYKIAPVSKLIHPKSVLNGSDNLIDYSRCCSSSS